MSRRIVTGAAIATIGLAGTPSVQAADDIRARYGPLELTVTVDSIETYLKDGTVNADLAAYLKRLTPEQRESLDQALRLSIETEQTA
ncbi:MAG: alpha/beta hydrolase, partial [Elainellaceae cyanobacterium]